MKTIFRVLVLGLAAGVCLFTSCKKDDGVKPEPYVMPDSFLLRSSFLTLDQDGNVVECSYGSYDPTQPGVVNITVKNYARALELIKTIVPEEADVTETENELVWKLKDAEGNSEGQMVFKRSSAPGQFAVAEIPECSRPLVQVVFKKPLLTDSWMDEYNQCDALDNFYLGAPVEVQKGRLPEGAVCNSFGHGQGKFLVIRDYEAGVQDGLLLRLNNTENDYRKFITDFYEQAGEHCKRAMQYSEVTLVRRILKNNTSFVDTMKAMGMASWDNDFLFYTETGWVGDEMFVSESITINFKTGDMASLALLTFHWYYREAWLYKFYVEPSKEDGSLKVIIDHSKTSSIK